MGDRNILFCCRDRPQNLSDKTGREAVVKFGGENTLPSRIVQGREILVDFFRRNGIISPPIVSSGVCGYVFLPGLHSLRRAEQGLCRPTWLLLRGPHRQTPPSSSDTPFSRHLLKVIVFIHLQAVPSLPSVCVRRETSWVWANRPAVSLSVGTWTALKAGGSRGHLGSTDQPKTVQPHRWPG